MKGFTVTICFILLSTAAHPDDEADVAPTRPPAEHGLTVQAKYGEPAQGIVRFAIYASKDDFLRSPLDAIEAPLEDGIAEVTFPDLPEGEYAVSAYLDLNGNGELDARWFGAPSEPVGSSNDAKGRFGPPSWKDAQFTLSEAGDGSSFTLACPVGCD